MGYFQTVSREIPVPDNKDDLCCDVDHGQNGQWMPLTTYYRLLHQKQIQKEVSRTQWRLLLKSHQARPHENKY